jgi:hypothetical protein
MRLPHSVSPFMRPLKACLALLVLLFFCQQSAPPYGAQVAERKPNRAQKQAGADAGG